MRKALTKFRMTLSGPVPRSGLNSVTGSEKLDTCCQVSSDKLPPGLGAARTGRASSARSLSELGSYLQIALLLNENRCLTMGTGDVWPFAFCFVYRFVQIN